MALLRPLLLVLALAAFVPNAVTAQADPADLDLSNAITTLQEIDVEGYPQVNMRVRVTDSGALVTGLGPRNFRVFENDGARGDLTVTPYTPPLSIVLAIDSSGSMSGAMTETKFAAQSLIDRLAEEDRAQIVSFADDVSTLATLTSNKLDLADAIFGLRAWGNTRLYDAVTASVGMVPSTPGARTAVILLSDGLDSDGNGNTLSALTRDQALAAAAGSGVPIFAIGLGNAINAEFLSQVAQDTGGAFYTASSANALGDIYRQIGDRLLEQEYMVSFTSPLRADGTPRQIEIVVAGSLEDTPRQTARVVRMPGQQVGRFASAPGGVPAPASGAAADAAAASTGSVTVDVAGAAAGAGGVDAEGMADDLAEQLTALAGGGQGGTAPAPVDPNQIAALLGVSTSQLDANALASLPPDMLGPILAAGMGGAPGSVDPAAIAAAVSALNAAEGGPGGAAVAGAALQAMGQPGSQTGQAPIASPSAPGGTATGAFTVAPQSQTGIVSPGGTGVAGSDGSTPVPAPDGSGQVTAPLSTSARQVCAVRDMIEREDDTIRGASRSFGAGGLDSDTRAAMSRGASERMARGAADSGQPICLQIAFETLSDLRARGDLTPEAFAAAGQILQQSGRAACRAPANADETAACSSVYGAEFAEESANSDGADGSSSGGSSILNVPGLGDRGDFLAFVEAKIAEHLGPMGNWIVLGGLGLLLILLTLPVMLVKREDPLDKLKMSQSDHKDLIEATKLRQGRSSADKLEKYSNFLEPQDKAEYTAIQLKLLQAGYRTKGAVRMYHFAQFALGILFLLAGVAYAIFKSQTAIAGEEPTTQSTILAIVIPGAIGYMIPKYWVNKRQQERQQEIEDGFPDSLDMMLVCVEAGQSLDQAIIRVARELKAGFPALSWEFELVAYEMKAGKDKTSVLKDMAERCGVQDVTSFVTVLIQSQQFGTSIADALRIYAGEMRDKRVMRAEEKANTLPTKMTLATMMLTVPPLLIILIGPSVFDIYENLIMGAG